MNKVLDKLPALIDEELQAAIDEHGDFHGYHEGYAVLLEEVEELEEEVESINRHKEMLWYHITHDNAPAALEYAKAIKHSAMMAAAEAIQVAAMAQKIIRYGDAS